MFALLLTASHWAWAQEASDSEVEELYDKTETQQPVSNKASRTRTESAPALKDAQNLSDLANLAPFNDVAVIQRRFLPKTGRFEFSGSGFTNLNNPFFTNLGLGLGVAYYFREKYAVEGIFKIASTGSRQVTDDLEANRGITTDNIVGSKGFGGLALKWNPIYGKMTWLNETIVPFDLNFSLGVGLTRTTLDEDEATIHFGTSQVFALSKGMAFRWDLAWNMYQATVPKDGGGTEKLNQNDLFLGLGMSFYFPEASYR